VTRIKICGLREVAHALVAAEAGAHYLGVICWPGSRRYVEPERIKAILNAMNTTFDYQIRPLVVGVFVNATAESITELVRICGLDLVQLSGDEGWADCDALPVPVLKALRVPPERPAADLLAELDHELPVHRGRAGKVLIESYVAGQFGGTGQTANWGVAGEVARHHPFLLSGGLTPENVGEAVRTVRPWGVDVASGVETDGVKDAAKIRSFIAAVHAADAAIAAATTPAVARVRST